MTTTFLSPLLVQRFWSNSAAPLAGGQVFTYAAGTNTPQVTYTDSTGNAPNGNPVVLNARGEASIWIPPNTGYKFVIQDASGNTIPGGTIDNVVNAALVSLYGGTDTGSANSYILNFASPLPPNTQGQVVYWVPSNTNSGPSSINVNGGGYAPILNPNGTALGAGQIIAGQALSIIYLSGIWQLYGGSGAGVSVGTFATETPVPAAATTDLGSVTGHNVQITGQATITSFGTSAQTQAPVYLVRFSDVCTLTPSAALIVPGNIPITTAAGDAALCEYMGNGNWRVVVYQPTVTGGRRVQIKSSDTARTSNAVLTADPDLQSQALAVGACEFEALLIFDSVAAGAGFQWQLVGTAVDSRASMPSLAMGLVNASGTVSGIDPIAGAISYGTVSTTVNGNRVQVRGSLLISTAGTFGINWAQAVSTASATTLRAGSFLDILQVSNTLSAAGVRHTYTSGSGTETIPAGYNTCLIEVWGSGGGGGARFLSSPNGAGGGGGGSGGYAAKSISVTGQGGKTMNYQVGAGGALFNAGNLSQVTSGTFTLPATVQGNGASPGTAASSLTVPGAGGAGGTATGGDTNTTGNAGSAGQSSAAGAHGGPGGAGIPGVNGGGNPGGTGQGTFQGTGALIQGTAGGAGLIVFSYSP